jgi:glycosyltransferase involved in cell wall biosynthesis
MRILVANEQAEIVGGIETYLRWLVPELAARGHEVIGLTRYPGGGGEAWVPKWATAVLTSDALELREVARGCDVAFMNSLGRVELEEALATYLPTVLFAHGFYGTCVSGTKMHAFPRRQPCERVLSWKCLALYGPRRCGGANPVTAVQLFERETARARLLRRFKRIVVASQYMVEEFVRNGLARDRLDCVTLPVQRPSAAPVISFRRRVLFLGRMTTVKGIDLLLEAVASVSGGGEPVEVDLAGDGPLRKVAEARARRLGISARFHGWVDERQRAVLFGGSGVVALPSTWPEPFGLVGLEAAAHGVPAVAFDVGGIREWLVPGVTGELATSQPPTAAGFGAALERALRPSHWSELSKGAYANSARFSPAAHVDSIESCLNAVRT